MANFLLVFDPDRDRRETFSRKAKARLAFLEGLEESGCRAGDFECHWAAPSRVPVSQWISSPGAAIVWGEPIRNGSRNRVEAASLAEEWTAPAASPPPVYDGYFGAVVFHPPEGITLGGDLLGLFPIYYYCTGNILLAGSSPELFALHPLFRPRVSFSGLTGYLLLGHLFDGQTLWEGVRRLGAGHVLRWQPGSPPRELLHYALPISKRHFNLPFSTQVAWIEEAMESILDRHVPPGKPCGVLFSGGMDSRLLGGYLRGLRRDVEALTFGTSSDLEMQCASRAVKALHFPHRKKDIDFHQFPTGAELFAQWDHLAPGFNGIYDWTVLSEIAHLPPLLVSGHVLDGVLVGHMLYSCDGAKRTASFERYFSSINAWGVAPNLLKQLYKTPSLRELVDERLERIRTLFDGYSDLLSQRVMGFSLHHRARFHVGSWAWHASFASHPVLPALDRELLAHAFGLPASTLMERRLESEMLVQRFPDLAALPLDRNALETQVLKPRLRQILREYILNQTRRALRPIIQAKPKRRLDHLYYYRIFDIHNSGWQAVRRLAEPFREALNDYFVREELERYLPAPSQPVPVESTIAGASGRKAVLGLMLWMKRHS